nr:hypothetical protein [Tanacetum cinerariifolium]
MNQNNNDEERHSTAFEIDDETDVYFLEQVVVGANNNINVLDNSPLFDDLLDDKASVAPFVVTTAAARTPTRDLTGAPLWESVAASIDAVLTMLLLMAHDQENGANVDAKRSDGCGLHWDSGAM